MNIKVQFKEYIRWSSCIIGENGLNSCLAILRNNMITLERQFLNSGMKKQFIISNYYIRETNRGMKPCVIGIEPDSESTGRFYLYEIKYSTNKNMVYFSNIGEWEYDPCMGSKKNGWRIIKLEDIMQYIDVIVNDVVIYDGVYKGD